MSAHNYVNKKTDGSGYVLVNNSNHVLAEDKKVDGLVAKIAAIIKSGELRGGVYVGVPVTHDPEALTPDEHEQFW